MADYNERLNQDIENIKTSAEWDGTKWINRVKAQEIEDAIGILNNKDFATEAKLELVRNLLDTISKKDFATQAGFDNKADIKLSTLRDAITATGIDAKTLKDLYDKITVLENKMGAIKDTDGIKKIADSLPAGSNKIGKVDVDSSALPTGAATSAKQDSMISTLGALLTKTGFDSKQDLKVSELRDALRGVSNKTLSDLATVLATLATSAKQDILAGLIGEKQSTPTAHTLLARIKNLEDKLDAVIEDGSVNTKLTGSNMELYGASINDRPAANTVPAGATFTIVDRDLDKNWISDGTNWEEV